MARRQIDLQRVSLQGLTAAPSQVWSGIRLVPLLREDIREDLRLFQRRYDEDIMGVALDGKQPDTRMRTSYWSYVPHGLVVTYSDDGSPAVAYGTQVFRKDGKRRDFGCLSVRFAHRMVKREDKHRLRFLPQHLSMEGFLSLHFEGPDVAWSEYARSALSFGLGMRSETAVPGRYISGLADALRVFEIHERQVGMLIFVADALAAAVVYPTPADYRAIHRTLLEDFYGELLYYYGILHPANNRLELAIDHRQVETVDDLRAQLSVMRAEWADFLGFMASGVLERPVLSKQLYYFGPFTLHRFMTELDRRVENHLGEAIVRDDGTLEYLQTYRLSASQCRRAHLLGMLARHNWNIDATAAALNASRDELILRLDKAGFGYLLKPHVLEAARKKKKKQKKR